MERMPQEQVLQWFKDASSRLNEISIETILEWLWKFGPVGFPIARLHSGHFIERVRPHKKRGERFYHPHQVTYISDQEIIDTIGLGRANLSKQSIFYGALMSTKVDLPVATAYFETSTKLRGLKIIPDDFYEEFTLSTWEIKEQMSLVEMVFSERAIQSNPDVAESFSSQVERMSRNDNQQFITEYLTFFSDEFARDDCYGKPDNYKLSASFYNHVLELLIRANRPVSGFSYPSVQTNHEGHNVALLPEEVDHFLQIKEVKVFKCEKDPVTMELTVVVVESAQKDSTGKLIVPFKWPSEPQSV